jgi:hypothetical protein
MDGNAFKLEMERSSSEEESSDDSEVAGGLLGSLRALAGDDV